MLQLRIYPISEANTFIGLAEADAILEYNVDYLNWDELDSEDKTRYLVKAFNEIITLEGLTVPQPTPLCLREAQADTAMRYITNGLTNDYHHIKSEKLGPMTTVYNDTTMQDPTKFSERSMTCFLSLGAMAPKSQGALGSMPKTRY